MYPIVGIGQLLCNKAYCWDSCLSPLFAHQFECGIWYSCAIYAQELPKLLLKVINKFSIIIKDKDTRTTMKSHNLSKEELYYTIYMKVCLQAMK